MNQFEMMSKINEISYEDIMKMTVEEFLKLKKISGPRKFGPEDVGAQELVFELFKKASPYYVYLEGIVEDEIIKEVCFDAICDYLEDEYIEATSVFQHNIKEIIFHAVPNSLSFEKGDVVTVVAKKENYGVRSCQEKIRTGIIVREDAEDGQNLTSYLIFLLKDDQSIVLECLKRKFNLMKNYKIKRPDKNFGDRNGCSNFYQMISVEMHLLKKTKECPQRIENRSIFVRNWKDNVYYNQKKEIVGLNSQKFNIRLINFLKGDLDAIIEDICSYSFSLYRNDSKADEELEEEARNKQDSSVNQINRLMQTSEFDSFVKDIEKMREFFGERAKELPEKIIFVEDK